MVNVWKRSGMRCLPYCLPALSNCCLCSSITALSLRRTTASRKLLSHLYQRFVPYTTSYPGIESLLSFSFAHAQRSRTPKKMFIPHLPVVEHEKKLFVLALMQAQSISSILPQGHTLQARLSQCLPDSHSCRRISTNPKFEPRNRCKVSTISNEKEQQCTDHSPTIIVMVLFLLAIIHRNALGMEILLMPTTPSGAAAAAGQSNSI